mgnify:CR=1 FL=1
MFKKVKRTRAFVCLLVMFAVLLVWGFAENVVQAPAADGAAEATVEEALDAPAEDTLERDLAAANGETDFAGGTVRVIEAQEEEETTQIDFVSGMQAIWESTGLANGDWQQYVMILIAFTNYDRNHLVPAKLFTWVGLGNFELLFNMTADSTFAYAFGRVLAWTMIWAVLATFTCYFGGILLAMFINNKNTRGKKFWRTCFMVAIAVPQFVSLLLVRNFFADAGIVNTLCKNAGLTDWLYSIGAIPTANYIPFLTHPAWARPMIILINIWVGVPYQMLIATGILMNIPNELLESARIDGANAWQSFKSITMPYILFITGPSLVNSIVSNINNFNVIYLLSKDVYTTSDQLMANANANEVDLLVTWLYRLTQDQSNYKMASVIGIPVFIVCAILTLLAFNRMIRGDKEENFQ